MPGLFKKIDTAYGSREFHFIGLRCLDSPVFFVSVRDPFLKAHVLELQLRASGWVMTSRGVPQWLQELEGVLAEVVEDICQEQET